MASNGIVAGVNRHEQLVLDGIVSYDVVSPKIRYRVHCLHLVLPVLMVLTLSGCTGSGPDPVIRSTDLTATAPSSDPHQLPVSTPPLLAPTPSASMVTTTPTGHSIPTPTPSLTVVPDRDTDVDDRSEHGDGGYAGDAPAVEGEIVSDHAFANLVASVDGTVGVVVARPDGTIIYEHDSGGVLEAASLYKLGIMVEVYREREMELLSFDEEIVISPRYFLEGEDAIGEELIGLTIPIERLLELMVTLSSNVAATALLDRVGTHAVNETLGSLGLATTEIRWSPNGRDLAPGEGEDAFDVDADAESEDEVEVKDGESDDDDVDESIGRGNNGVATRRLARVTDEPLNVTSAADMAVLFTSLLRGEAVNAQASQEMLDLLGRQLINDRLPAYLPTETPVAHKTGNLEQLTHDAGVIYGPAGPIVVVVLTAGVEEAVAVEFIAEIGRLAYLVGT